MTARADQDRSAAIAAANWHGAWFAALSACALGWAAGLGATGPALALFLAAAPGAVGLLLRWRDNWAVRALIALSWPAGIAAALTLTGGVESPLAPLALAPAAAMAALEGRRLIALGAVLTVAVVAVVGIGSSSGLIAPPAAAAEPWLALVALMTAALGLAAALLVARARSLDREAVQSRAAARLGMLLDAAPLLILRIDDAGVVREAFSSAHAAEAARTKDRSFEMLACESDRDAAKSALALARQGGVASVGFAPPLAPDRWLAVELRALPGGEALAILRDASFERAHEAHLEQARQDAESTAAAKSRFLANMSHELRTPLNAIIGFSDIMRSSLFGPLSERYAEYAGLIHESGGHLLDLINDVLDMSKIEAERFVLSREIFDAREAVASALRLTRVQADTARIALRGALPPQPIDVDADRRALKQIVLNLVSNALKFTPAGGEVNVLARPKDGELELIVADTGVGISQADLERLGRPYEQAGGADQRAMGTGLGLSLVRALAELHGGRMTIKSILGEGTVVSVRLPVIVAAEVPGENLAIETEPAAGPALAKAPLLADAEPATAFGRKTAALGDNVIAFKPQR